jgi:pimeloyl-ACP methyl ester carboxylesterase
MAHARNGDVQLWYETFGDPADPALLLVNGLGSQCVNFRSEWCERFAAAGFLTIRFDNRDVGLSTSFDDVPPGEVAYTLGDMAGDAVAVLDALGIDRAHVLGVSMGGMIVQTVAIEHPERVLSLTSVMSSTGDPDVGNPTEDALALITAPAPTTREEYLDRQVQAILTWGSPEWIDEDRIRAWQGEAFDRCFHPAGQTRQMAAIVTAPSRTEALAKVEVPTLVIHGTADRLVDPSGGVRTAEAVPGARLELIEGMGHDYPPQVWDRIVGLVAAIAAGGSPADMRS